VQTVRFDDLDLDAVAQDAPDAAWLAGFPFDPDRPGGTTGDDAAYTVVYNELEPGRRIGRHTDSVDELLLVLAGTVEATVGEETGTVAATSLAILPAGTPHAVANVGGETARLVGLFPDADVRSTFETEPAVVGEGREGSLRADDDRSGG